MMTPNEAIAEDTYINLPFLDICETTNSFILPNDRFILHKSTHMRYVRWSCPEKWSRVRPSGLGEGATGSPSSAGVRFQSCKMSSGGLPGGSVATVQILSCALKTFVKRVDLTLAVLTHSHTHTHGQEETLGVYEYVCCLTVMMVSWECEYVRTRQTMYIDICCFY